MNLILFLTILIVAFVVVRIGAIAFELTGLEWSLAKFQALSCFTGTGYTTKESELITAHPQRRRIASVLIVLGHAGLVTMIATFANSLRPGVIMSKFNIPFLHLVFSPGVLPWMNFTIIALAAYAIYKVFTHSKFAIKFTAFLRAHIVKKGIINPVSFEELALLADAYGISQIEICKDNPLLDKALRDSELRVKFDITVLAIERKERIIPNPPADMKILLGDKLICFGKLENIRREVYVTCPSAQTEELQQ